MWKKTRQGAEKKAAIILTCIIILLLSLNYNTCTGINTYRTASIDRAITGASQLITDLVCKT